jgi:hypothetical protein
MMRPFTRRNALIGVSAAALIPGYLRAQPADDVVKQFMVEGGWSLTADDNAHGEALSQDLLEKIIKAYAANPKDEAAQRGLGLIALGIAVAEWGVRDPKGLPPDPAGKNWASQSSAGTGKHLMSYVVGGVGVAHYDVGDLVAFVNKIADSPLVPAANKQEYRDVVDVKRFPAGKLTYDRIRAAGLCNGGMPSADLRGEPFQVPKQRVDAPYCAKQRSELGSKDWLVFATWTRVALRDEGVQRDLLGNWLSKYWQKSLAFVAPGLGFEEEAFINVRFRNSLSGAANTVKQTPGVDTPGRVARELAGYARADAKAYNRRCKLMQRPVVLYRHFTGQSPILPYTCPVAA